MLEALKNFGFSEEEAQKIIENTKQLRHDLAESYQCTPEEAERVLLKVKLDSKKGTK